MLETVKSSDDEEDGETGRLRARGNIPQYYNALTVGCGGR